MKLSALIYIGMMSVAHGQTSGVYTDNQVSLPAASLNSSLASKQDYPLITQTFGTNNTTAASTAFIAQGVQTRGITVNLNPYTPPIGFPNNGVSIQAQETVTGTCTAGSSSCHYNYINISSDNAVVGPGTTGVFSTGEGFLVNLNYGGAAMTGNRVAGVFNTVQTAATGNTSAGVSYGGIAVYANGTANDNGTDNTLPNSRGQLETINFIAHLGPSATFWRAVQGGEIDVYMEAGSSAYEKTGWQIVELATDAVRGSTVDAALVISNATGAIGWTNGILFGGAQGIWPFYSSSTVITCATPCGSATSFIDMTGATFSGFFLNAGNFSVNGSGVITTGLNGTVGGSLRLRGSTSGGSSITTSTGGNLIISNGSANQVMQFDDAGNGVAFQVVGTSSTIANRLNVTPGIATVMPALSATGTDTNVSLNLTTQGTGVLQINGTPGVTCATGLPSASFASVGGLVTHC